MNVIRVATVAETGGVDGNKEGRLRGKGKKGRKGGMEKREKEEERIGVATISPAIK